MIQTRFFFRYSTVLFCFSVVSNSAPGVKVPLLQCIRVAHSDGHYKAVEASVVHALLAEKFNLSSAAVADLIDYAHDHRAESLDLFQFAREINAHFSREEKLDVMEGIWRVIYADGSLDRYEDALARQLATLLRLDHKDVIDRKLKILDEVKGRDA